MKKGFTVNVGDMQVRYFCNLADFDAVGREHCHDKYEIILALSPLGICSVEGNEYSLDPRTLLLIPPLSYHTHTPLDEAEGYTVSFPKSALFDSVMPMIEKITVGGESGGRFYALECVCDSLIDIFSRFEDAELLPEAEKCAYVRMLICEVVIFLSAAEGRIISHNEQELGARVAKYLNSNIEKNISLDKLASRFFVSKYHLCRAFKKYSGASVHSYINHKRIMYAKQLIESGESASGAAERVGFGDYSAFYRAYVRIVGNSPTKN